MDDGTEQFSRVSFLKMFGTNELVKSSLIVLLCFVPSLVFDKRIVILLVHYYRSIVCSAGMSAVPSNWIAGLEASHSKEATMHLPDSC